MFERYTEKARRVIFFSRYEASQFGAPYIETEHLLLGLLREYKALTDRFLRQQSSAESIREQIEKHSFTGEKTPTSVDLPLSNECKRVLAYSAEEAERMKHKHIGTEHLLLGLLREESCFAAEILRGHGLTLEKVREQISGTLHVGVPNLIAADLSGVAPEDAPRMFRAELPFNLQGKNRKVVVSIQVTIDDDEETTGVS